MKYLRMRKKGHKSKHQIEKETLQIIKTKDNFINILYRRNEMEISKAQFRTESLKYNIKDLDIESK